MSFLPNPTLGKPQVTTPKWRSDFALSYILSNGILDRRGIIQLQQFLQKSKELKASKLGNSHRYTQFNSVSMIFSVIIVTLAYPLFYDEAITSDKLFGYSDYSRSVYAITCGYFLWDTLISIYYIGETGIPFVFHGSACFCVFFLSYVSKK
ncbi:hypothetical protein HDV01_000258 [Terramyces sp. JEL0728]|nr:hypothetical protein HDV01_000258 [Terramyces sp. JEL0728]